MGLFDKGLDTIQKGIALADQAITDTDKLNELKFNFMNKYLDSLYTGKKGLITCCTLCFLVSLVVVSVMVKWLFTGNVTGATAILPPVMSAISVLTGGWVYSSTQKKKYDAITNGNGNATNSRQSTTKGSRKPRPPSSYRPTDDPTADRGPSDTKRDHPGGGR